MQPGLTPLLTLNSTDMSLYSVHHVIMEGPDYDKEF